DRMHARLADVLRSLAAFARVASQPPGDIDARRQLIAQQVADVQGFIESSKFEAGADGADAQAVERLTAEAQTVFVMLLAIARAAASAASPADAVDVLVARILQQIADGDTDVDGSLAALERSIDAQGDAAHQETTYTAALALYRELGVAVKRLVWANTSVTAIGLAEVTGWNIYGLAGTTRRDAAH